MRVVKTCLWIVLVLSGMTVSGQGVSSVYSNRGIGLVNFQGLPHNMGMGDIGIGTPSVWNTNVRNPAFLPFNVLTSFQVGLQLDKRTISADGQSLNSTAGGLQYFNLSMPVMSGKWTTSIGLAPYSFVNYNTYTSGELDGSEVIYAYSGSGGLTNFNWLNGFKVSKNVYVGLRTSYVFGSVEHQIRHELSDDDLNVEYDVAFIERSAYSDWTFGFAFGFRKELPGKKILNFGLIYDLPTSFAGNREKIYERRQPRSGFLIESYKIGKDKAGFALPGTLGIGASCQMSKNLLFAADFEFQSWNDTGLDTEATEYSSAQRFGFGAEWTPEIGSVNSYFKRVTYRFGLSQQNLPFDLNGRNIRDLGINFGASLPVGLSSMDLAVRYGIMGTTKNDLVRENYFRVVLGATINDRWFVKRRYD
jgi:hypothetical protein